MSHQHILKRFDDELNVLNDLINSMFKVVRKNIKDGLKSIFEGDLELANKVIEHDALVNALELKIDEVARSLIVHFQPAATDLRFVFAASKIVIDLERMSDLATSLARNAIEMDGTIPRKSTSIPIMRELVLTQVKCARNAFVNKDLQQAREVIEHDQLINDSFDNCQRVLLTRMAEDHTLITQCMAQSNIAKIIERIGDHATNIAEMIIFTTSSHEVRHLDLDELNSILDEDDD